MPYEMRPEMKDRFFKLDMDVSHFPEMTRLELFRPGVELPEELRTVKLKRTDDGSDYDDLMTGHYSSTRIVSDRLRALIEARANDRCTFAPVEFTGGAKPPAERAFYMFIMIDLVDSIDPARSEVKPSYSAFDGELYAYSISPNAKIQFKRENIAGRHIWCDKYAGSRLFVSDEMKEEIESSGCSGIVLRNLD